MQPADQQSIAQGWLQQHLDATARVSAHPHGDTYQNAVEASLTAHLDFSLVG